MGKTQTRHQSIAEKVANIFYSPVFEGIDMEIMIEILELYLLDTTGKVVNFRLIGELRETSSWLEPISVYSEGEGGVIDLQEYEYYTDDRCMIEELNTKCRKSFVNSMIYVLQINKV